MKRFISLTVAIMVIALVTVAQAEIKAGSASITPFVGGYFFEKNQNFKDSVVGGLRAGYNFTENIGMEGFVSFLTTEIQDVPGEPWHNVYSAGIEGIYHFLPEGRFVPFIAIGVGGTHYGYPEAYRLNKFTVDYGAGVKFFITDNIALRADVRHVLPINDRYNDLLATLGISFSFGGHTEIAQVDIEEPSAPQIPEIKAEEPPAPKVPEVKVEDPPIPEVQVAEPPPPVVEQKPEIREKVSIALNVEFDTNKAVIKNKYHKEIKTVADFMKEHPETKAIIDGHTDNVDIYHEPDRNMRLSQARADSVRKYLIHKFGIDPSRVTATGYGPNKPIAGNDTKEGRRKNRRVEAVIE